MRVLRVLCVAVLLIVTIGTVCAEEAVVWQVGKFDENYEELAIPHNHGAYSATFPNDVTFVVGKDDPAKAWSFIQPGPMDEWAGAKSHPFTVAFNLPEKPVGLYRLKIALVNTHYGFPPVLEIKVNDKAGSRNLPGGGGDEALFDAVRGVKREVNLNVPSALLRKGENKLVLTIVGGSYLLYDAVAITNDPSVAEAEATIGDVTLAPTSRFVRRGKQLKRVAVLSAQLSGATANAVAKVVLNGRTQTVNIESGLFETVSTEIEIDDVDKPTRAEVTLQCGSQTKTASCDIKPGKRWKLFIMPTVHVDVGYTDVQENVKVRHNQNTSVAIDLCKKYSDFVWNMEVAWPQDNYLSMMPDDRKEEFIKLAKAGRIGCQVIYGNMLTGICSHESLIRDLYYAHDTSRKYDIPFDMAASTDVPTQVWTLPSVLAGSGIKYFAAGLNLVRAGSFNRLFNKPFYWQSPDGVSVLTWLSPGYGAAGSLGLSGDLASAKAAVDGYVGAFDRPDYPYDAVFGHGAVGDNGSLSSRLASVVHEWNKTYAYPQIILCRGPEFFQHIEKHFEDKIPTLKGDGGVYWEDGAGSSAKETAANRIAKEDLVTAEKLFALAGGDYPSDEIAEAWKNIILYDEHTWGAAGSISDPESKMTRDQWAYKAKFARDASKQAAQLKEQALDNLAKSIEVKEPSVVVFNPLSWPVSDIVRAQRLDGSTVEISADVPAMSFKTYPLSSAPSETSTTEQSAKVLENRFYRMVFDNTAEYPGDLSFITGAVLRLYDKELGRELVDTSSPYGINQYVYMSGLGDAQKEDSRSSVGAKLTKIIEPGRQIMRIEAIGVNKATWTAEVVLYDDQKRIDFINVIDKNLAYEKEGGYFAFPFALNKPEFRVELPNGVVSPNKDMLDGACMAWYCAQDFVAASDEGVSVVWTSVDSPLLTLCDVNYETSEGWNMPKAASNWPSKLDNGHIYGYAFNNYWFTNYKAGQSGKLTFRFSLTSMKSYDPVAASRFGQSARNPLLVRVVNPTAAVLRDEKRVPKHNNPTAAVLRDEKRVPKHNNNPPHPSPLPPGERGQVVALRGKSLCSVSPSNVSIQAIKRAQTGDGTIIRLRELSGKDTKVTIAAPALRFEKAWKCSLVEDRLGSLPVSKRTVTVEVPANGMATVLLR